MTRGKYDMSSLTERRARNVPLSFAFWNDSCWIVNNFLIQEIALKTAQMKRRYRELFGILTHREARGKGRVIFATQPDPTLRTRAGFVGAF
jgi:hypothetical protein